MDKPSTPIISYLGPPKNNFFTNSQVTQKLGKGDPCGKIVAKFITKVIKVEYNTNLHSFM